MAESNADQAFNGFLFTFPQKEHVKNEWRKKLLVAQTLLDINTAVCLLPKLAMASENKIIGPVMLRGLWWW